MTLYHDIAHKISKHITNGVYPPGSRLPGVRRLSQQFGVSISTIVLAQRQLENRGLLEARPRSGYYVCTRNWLKPQLPVVPQTNLKPVPVTGQDLVLHLAKAANQADFIQLGAAVPDASLLPSRAIQRSLNKATRNYDKQTANYIFPPGLPELRQQIARRMYLYGSEVKPEQILITNGCQESLALALQSIAKPGDIIAIESPTFYGLLQVIESLGMKALEIPTNPQDGMSIRALELALEQWPVKACVLIPNYSNPLGCLMPLARKQQLVELAQQTGMMLIEDDIYADLGFNGEHSPALHGIDQQYAKHQVIYCSSFSKTIAPGLRVGWMILPERHFQRAEYLKYVSNLATPTLPQMALTDFLQQGGYERYLRQIQPKYAQLTERFAQAISQHFPAGTRVSQPAGGFVLWVELEESRNTLELTHAALARRISIAPGQIFSASQKYQNCIRLNCAQPWSTELETALKVLGKLCHKYK